MAAQRIVVRYAGTAAAQPTTRSREQALLRARDVLAEARAGTPFEKLIQRYSEHPDKDSDGRIGVWSTSEPSPEPLVIEALADAPVGELLSELYESPVGFQIVKRTAKHDRARLAARVSLFSFPFDDVTSRARAEREAKALVRELERDPARAAQLRDASVVRWFEGAVDPRLTRAVHGLELGAVSPIPVDLDDAFAVVTRLAADDAAAVGFNYELPRPRLAPLQEIDSFVHSSSASQLLHALAGIHSALSPVLLPGEVSALERALHGLEIALPRAPSGRERVDAYQACLNMLRRSLPVARYALITRALQHWVSERKLELYRP